MEKFFNDKKMSITLIDTSRVEDKKLHRELKSFVPHIQKVFSGFLLGKTGLDLKSKGIKSASLAITLCGEKKIRGLNRDYRGKDKVTDVLSFPINESLRPHNCDLLFVPELELGDVIICHQVAKRQAVEFKVTYAQEIVHELVHAFLHLVGYDHERGSDEEKLMFDLEEKLVAKVYKLAGF
ncbi:MAG: rRNA maturation RNase YbeY [Bacteriovoracaceae bacterium]|nr:rRNA maturation RNase YbeY [Bacteriovoracaceae bacterium]